MAFRLNDYLIGGEIYHSRRNSIIGFLDFAPGWGVRIELAGNLTGQFEGKSFRFRSTLIDAAAIVIDELPQAVHDLADMQIGVIGDCELRKVRVSLASPREMMARAELGEPAPEEIKDCLYLEWFSQNGRLVAEVVAPVIEFINDDAPHSEELPPPPIASPLPGGDDDTCPYDDANLNFPENEAAEPQDDPYHLFDSELQQQISESLPDFGDGDSEAGTGTPRSWDEVIPGIDPETKAMYEQWDEIFHGDKDEPITGIFDPPIRLPEIETMRSDKQAWPVLKTVLAALAMHGVAIDICEHYGPLRTLRWLVNDILPDAKINPNLVATSFVQHYCTFEFCQQCDAEFDARCEAENEDSHQDDHSDDEPHS